MAWQKQSSTGTILLSMEFRSRQLGPGYPDTRARKLGDRDDVHIAIADVLPLEVVQGERREGADGAEGDARHAELAGDADVPGEVHVGDDRVRRLRPGESLLRRARQMLAQGSGVDAPRVGLRGPAEVLHALRESVHGRERVGGYLDMLGLPTSPEQGLDDRDVGRRDGDGGLHCRSSGDEADGEVSEGLDVAGGEEGEDEDAQHRLLAAGGSTSSSSGGRGHFFSSVLTWGW